MSPQPQLDHDFHGKPQLHPVMITGGQSPDLTEEGVLMWSKGSWGDRRPLEVGLKVGVSCKDNEEATPGNDRPENGAAC